VIPPQSNSDPRRDDKPVSSPREIDPRPRQEGEQWRRVLRPRRPCRSKDRFSEPVPNRRCANIVHGGQDLAEPAADWRAAVSSEDVPRAQIDRVSSATRAFRPCPRMAVATAKADPKRSSSSAAVMGAEPGLVIWTLPPLHGIHFPKNRGHCLFNSHGTRSACIQDGEHRFSNFPLAVVVALSPIIQSDRAASR
jgi:hypothetical protein